MVAGLRKAGDAGNVIDAKRQRAHPLRDEPLKTGGCRHIEFSSGDDIASKDGDACLMPDNELLVCQSPRREQTFRYDRGFQHIIRDNCTRRDIHRRFDDSNARYLRCLFFFLVFEGRQCAVQDDEDHERKESAEKDELSGRHLPCGLGQFVC